jgi:hypothetical protein
MDFEEWKGVSVLSKRVLDACCGSRMFWFDKQNPDVVFADNRELEKYRNGGANG